MIKLVKSLLIVLFIASYSLPAYSENSWITKKSDKSKAEIKKIIDADLAWFY